MNNRLKYFIISSLLLLNVISALGKSNEEDKIKNEIHKQNKIFTKAFIKEDVNEIMSVYWNSPELICYFPDADFIGYDNVKQSWKMMFDNLAIKNFEHTQSTIKVEGNIAYEFGHFKFIFQPKEGNEISSTGRYIAIWEEKNGKWVMTVDHASSTPPQKQTSK